MGFLNFELRSCHIICFFFGSCLGVYHPILPFYALAIFSLGCFFIKQPIIKSLSIFIFALVYASILVSAAKKEPLNYEMTNRLVAIKGVVLDIPNYSLTKNNALRASFTFQTQSIEGEQISRKIKVSTYDLVEVKAGQKWQFLAYLINPQTANLTQNYKNSLMASGIQLISYEAKKALKIDDQYLGDIDFLIQFKITLEKLRLGLLEKLALIHQSHFLIKPITIHNSSYQKKTEKERTIMLATKDDALPMIEALLLGYRGNLDKEHWQVFANFGISHLIAISGLHISLIVMFVFLFSRVSYFIFPQLSYFIHLYRFQAFFSLFMVIFYCLFTGFALPSIRASIMAFVLLVSYLQRKTVLSWHNYFLALFIVLLFNPLVLFSASFWFSFYAVFLIFLLLNLDLTSMQKGILLPIVLSLGIIPWQLFFFQSASLISPIANLILVPIFSFLLMPLVLFLLLAIMINLPFSFILYALIHSFFLKAYQFLSSFPNFIFEFNSFNFSLLLSALVVNLVIFIPKGIISKKIIIPLLFMMMFALINV